MFALYNRYSHEIKMESNYSSLIKHMIFDVSYLAEIGGIAYGRIKYTDINMMTRELWEERIRIILDNEHVFLSDKPLYVEKTQYIHLTTSLPSIDLEFVPDKDYIYLITNFTYFDMGIPDICHLLIDGVRFKDDGVILARRRRLESIECALESLK